MKSEWELPIEQAVPPLREALRSRGVAVLLAEPGAGKTTRVPLALLQENWLAGRKIVMLEPRRLAARNAARFMAGTLGEAVGETVGYRVRLDTKVGPRTRIEVVTEGVLTRMLQSDQALEEVGLVIFDEFHERSLNADLGLALCLQSRQLLREDLRLLVMSATLEAQPVAELLDNTPAPIIVCEGRIYPVSTSYLLRKSEWPIEQSTAAQTLAAMDANQEGDALVFLPGMAEIRRVESRLRAAIGGRPIEVLPLHGNLPQEAQDRALSPSPPGRRRIVLATAVAESSLTVAGIRIVVDSGLMRVPRFSPRTGMTHLATLQVSRPSADQRRGRAGRLAPGVCYRLWTEEEDRNLSEASTPEIKDADLAPLALDLAVWGVRDPAELSWIDPPPAAAFAQARELLAELGALTAEGALTPHGERMARLGAHPRLAHMMLAAQPLGLAQLACELAALLGERDLLRGAGADIALRIAALRGKHVPGAEPPDERVRQRLRADAQHRLRELREAAPASGAAMVAAGGGGMSASAANARTPAIARDVPASGPSAPDAGANAANDAAACGILLGFAYPDRIGRRRSPGRYTLSGGRGVVMPEGQPLAQSDYIAVAELDDGGTEGRIQLAGYLDEADLYRYYGDLIRSEQTVEWDTVAEAVRARDVRRLGAIVLREGPAAKPDPSLVTAALISGIRLTGLEVLPWTRAARQLQERVLFLRRYEPEAEWPNWSDETLAHELDIWLAPYLGGIRKRSELARLKLTDIFEAMLPWDRRSALDREAPTHWNVPSGSRLPIDYEDPDQPVLAVRLQEMFGLPDTPRIAGGRVPLTLHLLSPAQRPVQVTKDLASFWRNAYFEVRKDLKGRYPKHFWPDDPLEAPATRRARPPQSR